MAGSQQDTSVGFVFANDVRCRGGGQDPVLSNNEFCNAVGRTDFENDLDGFLREVASITPDNERSTCRVNRIEDGLDKILGVVLADQNKVSVCQIRE